MIGARASARTSQSNLHDGLRLAGGEQAELGENVDALARWRVGAERRILHPMPFAWRKMAATRRTTFASALAGRRNDTLA